ncbi:unnamed protein product [Urochloa humidicola]
MKMGSEEDGVDHAEMIPRVEKTMASITRCSAGGECDGGTCVDGESLGFSCGVEGRRRFDDDARSPRGMDRCLVRRKTHDKPLHLRVLGVDPMAEIKWGIGVWEIDGKNQIATRRMTTDDAPEAV